MSEKKEETAVAKTEDTAVAAPQGFGSLPDRPEPSTCAPGAVPYLGFYDKRSNRAEEIKATLPTIKDGDPYIGAGALYQAIGNSPVIFADISPTFHVETADDWVTPVKVSLTTFEDAKETIVASGMVVVDDVVTPFLSTLRTTKCSPAKVAFQYAAHSMKEGWADNKVKQALIDAEMPAMLRHYGELNSTQKTGKFTYYVARWTPHVLTIELASYIKQWLNTPEPAILAAEFTKRVAEFNALIGAKEG